MVCATLQSNVTLDEDAEDYLVMGKELFLPTIEQMRNDPEEQPAVQLLNNGIKIVQDAKVFLSLAKMFKKVDFVFSILPIVLTILTLVLFVLAIRPTLTAIIKLPAMAATGAGGVGKEVVANSLRRVKGELFASVCTIAVLVVLTLISSVVLGQIQWGAPAVLLVQVFPLVFALVSAKILAAVNDAVTGDALNAESISWAKMLLAGPAVLVLAFGILFWALRGVKAITFLAGYKVKPKASAAPSAPA